MTENHLPNDDLDAAGQAVRAFLHATAPLFILEHGWTYPSDAYRALGELSYLTGLLPQVFQHVTGALESQLADGRVGIDRGTKYEGRPDVAIAVAAEALSRGARAAHELRCAVDAAQEAINAAHYVTRDADHSGWS